MQSAKRIILSTFFLGLVTIVFSQNLISNAGFEQGSTAWIFGTWGGPSANFSTTTEEAQEGTQSMKIEVQSTDTEAGKVFIRQQSIILDPTKTYTAAFKVLSHSGQSESINLQLYSHPNIGSTGWGIAWQENTITFEGDGQWHSFSFQFTPNTVAGSPDFNNQGFMFGFARNANTFYLDNVSLTQEAEEPPTATRVYHVSKSGSDDNPGTAEEPFLTLGKAASLVQRGDTCIIHEGTYEETLRPATSGQVDFPIVFQAAANEKVIITAMQALSGWTQDEGAVYKTTVDWDLGQKNFVMNKDVACDLARWPNNEDGDPFTLNSLRNTGGSGEAVEFGAYLTHSQIPNWDWGNGGSILFYGDRPGSGWTTWKAFITSSSAGRVNFDLNKNPAWIRTFHPPADRGDYFLEGIREALDYQNEWYFDPSNKTLFLQLPGGVAPVDGEVSMRRRNLTIDLNGRNFIEIKNLALFGGGVEINGSHNVLEGVSVFYGSYTRGVVSGFNAQSQSVHIKGGNANRIERCEVAFGAATGIWDSGHGTHILNSNLHDFNFIGDYDGVIMARGGSASVIKYNTISRAGRDAIQILNKNSEVAFNDLTQSNLIADDCGLLYTLGPGLDMEIHHNWFHDIASRGDLKKATGVYLDNDAGNVSVHHNVIWNTEWSNIQINWNGTNIDVFNNTLWNGSAAMGAWHLAGTAFSNVRVWNNLTNKNSLEPQSDKQNNLIITNGTDPFNDSANGDFTLKAGVQAIDYGRVIDGITDGYVGANPDAGAYERGAEVWVPGIDWYAPFGPTGLGCYGLPGENCENVTATREIPAETVKVFPNPITFGQLTVELQEHVGEKISWWMHSISGQPIQKGSDILLENLHIRMTQVPPGVYLLRVKTADKHYQAKVIRL